MSLNVVKLNFRILNGGIQIVMSFILCNVKTRKNSHKLLYIIIFNYNL